MMSLRIISTLESFPFFWCRSMDFKRMSKDTRDTGCTQHRLCKRKYWPIVFPYLLWLYPYYRQWEWNLVNAMFERQILKKIIVKVNLIDNAWNSFWLMEVWNIYFQGASSGCQILPCSQRFVESMPLQWYGMACKYAHNDMIFMN